MNNIAIKRKRKMGFFRQVIDDARAFIYIYRTNYTIKASFFKGLVFNFIISMKALRPCTTIASQLLMQIGFLMK